METQNILELNSPIDDLPHSNGPAPLFFSATHWQVYDGLVESICKPGGLNVLTGPAGSGKTVLLRKVAERFAPVMAVAHLTYANLSLAGFAALLCFKLAPDDHPDNGDPSFMKLAEDLKQRAFKGEPVTILVDEAHNLTDEVLAGIHVLLEFKCARDGGPVPRGMPIVQIVLSGQPELKDRLRSDEMKTTAAAISNRLELSPLSVDEVGSLLRLRLNQARPQAGRTITPQAIERVAYYSRGLPRTVQNMCNLLIISGAETPGEPVTASMVDALADTVTTLKDGISSDLKAAGSSRDRMEGRLRPEPPRMIVQPDPEPGQQGPTRSGLPPLRTPLAALVAMAGVALISYGIGNYVMSATGIRTAGSPLSNQADRAVNPDKVTFDQAVIADYLDKGDLYLEVNRLTSPKDANALLMYRRALEIDPGNYHALEGLEKIKNKYVELADRFIVSGDMDQARVQYRSAIRVDPDDQSLRDLLANLP